MAKHEVTGKNFLITGGASGLGAYYVETFLREGAKKVAILDIAEELGKAFAAELNKKYPGKVIFVKCDVGDESDITAAFNEVVSKIGRLDVVLNNAGILNEAPHLWRKMISINLQGLISFTLKAIKHMKKDEGGAGGTIINVASYTALTKIEMLPIYSGTKMAVVHFSQVLALEKNFYEQTGIRILVICPAATDTALLRRLKEKGSDEESGKKLEVILDPSNMQHQRPESAAAAVLRMYKEGENGSIWLSVNDKPGKDITPLISAAFDSFLQASLN